jgi:hypothetical protein
MLTPGVQQQLDQLIAFHEKGVLSRDELSWRLTDLVTVENANEVMRNLPADLVQCVKDGLERAVRQTRDNEYLRPEDTPFQENPIGPAYFLRVAELLLRGSPGLRHPVVTVVCLPYFEVEWALRIAGSDRIGFLAALTEPAERIWCHQASSTIPVRQTQSPIDRDLAVSISQVWKRMLLRTKHAEHASVGLDGVSYHFVYWGSDTGKIGGCTWSPNQETVPGRLVALSEALRAYVKAQSGPDDRLRQSINGHIEWLRQVT